MLLDYERLNKVLVEARACINALEITVDAEKAYKTLKELERIAHKEAWNIRYSVVK